MTLFELLTLEGWPEVRGLFEGRDSTIDFVSISHFSMKCMHTYLVTQNIN